jgi:hypothetical protein
VQPAVTVSGLVSGACPAAPELAETVTTVVCETVFAACNVAAPPPVVQPPKTNGWPPAITDATAGLLLVALIWTPAVPAIFCSTTSMNETPPGAIVDGVSVNEVSGGGGGAVPPGFSVSVWCRDTSSRETPAPSVYASRE